MPKVPTSYTNFASVFRQFAGLGRRFSLKQIARATGIAPRTLKAYLTGQNEPGYSKLWTLKKFFLAHSCGAEFATALDGGLGLATIVVSAGKPCARKLAAVDAHADSALADAMEDGFIDHVEHAKIRPYGRAAALMWLQFTGIGEAA